jgi:hypothetical protein
MYKKNFAAKNVDGGKLMQLDEHYIQVGHLECDHECDSSQPKGRDSTHRARIIPTTKHSMRMHAHTHYYTHPQLYCCIRINSTPPVYASNHNELGIRDEGHTTRLGTALDWNFMFSSQIIEEKVRVHRVRRRCVYIE